ncbi:MAG: CARDB domain-containing protein, partial [Thermoplasmata archaeon]
SMRTFAKKIKEHLRLLLFLLFALLLIPFFPCHNSYSHGSRGCREDTNDCHTELTILNYSDCFCHNYTGSPSVNVEIEYPSVVEICESRMIKVSIFGGPGLKFGLGVNATFGQASPYFSNSTSNVFIINYTAPSKPCNDELTFAYLSANGDGNLTNDTWYAKKIKIKVIQKQTDLIVKSISAPKEVIVGEKFTINSYLSNIGNYSHSNVTIALSIDGEEYLRNKENFSENAEVIFSQKVTLKAGRHMVKVQIDPENLIEEIDETNNLLTKMVDAKEKSPSLSFHVLILFITIFTLIFLFHRFQRFRKIEI